MAKKAIVYCLLLHLSIVLLLLTSNSSSQSTARPNSGQLHALRAIMRDWGSPAALSPWSTGNWTGVACNRDGLVTALNFNNFHIANPIPASLCSLKNLSFIDLCFNNLTGRFPRVLYGCSALQHLDLSNNEFTSDLPGDMSKISSEMQHLNLSSNGFTGGVGPVVTAVSLLRLDLSMNRLTGPIPESIGKMKNLGLLFLSRNNITGPIPASVRLLPNLADVRLFDNKLSGPLPPELGKHSNLGNMDVSNNLLSGKLPAQMEGLAKVTYLNLAGNRISGPIPPSIQSFARLAYLNLSSNKISGKIPATIGSLPGLSILDPSNNELSGDIPQEVGNLHLDFLNLSSNNLAGQVPLSMQTPAYDRSFLGNSGLCVAAKLNMGLPACGRSMGSAGLIVLFAALSGVVLVGALAVVYPIIQRQKEQRDLTFLSEWKMTAFTHPSFTASDILTNRREENLVGSGGSGNVYQGRADQVVAVKKLLTTSKPDAKLDKQFDPATKASSTTWEASSTTTSCASFHASLARPRNCSSSSTWRTAASRVGCTTRTAPIRESRLTGQRGWPSPSMVAVFKLGVICTGEDPKSRPSMQTCFGTFHLFQESVAMGI